MVSAPTFSTATLPHGRLPSHWQALSSAQRAQLPILATASPLTLSCLMTGKTQRPPHLALIENLFCEAVAGRIPRLMICLPPRHGKSETCSHWGPTWALTQRPETRIILCSYGADYAATWGRKVRDSILEAHGLGLVAHTVAADLSRASEFEMAGHGGGMVTAGVGGPITGRGADLLLIDDPVKSAEEAASPTYRERSWEWYNATAMTRLEPGGSVVLIQTRWHHDDLAGRILAEGAEGWHVVNLPALAEEAGDVLGRQPGEALWPARYPAEVLRGIEKARGSYWWSALYQQRPTPREGGFFKQHWFTIIDAAPAEVGQRVRCWDKAATEGGGDWTVGVLMSRTAEGLFIVEDVRRVQESSGAVKTLILQTAALDGQAVQIVMEQEPGSSGKDVIADYRRALAGYTFKGVPATGDKALRADPFASQAEGGNVRLVRGPWNGAFIDELCAFDKGEHDDQVDAASGAFVQLASTSRYAYLLEDDEPTDANAADSE